MRKTFYHWILIIAVGFSLSCNDDLHSVIQPEFDDFFRKVELDNDSRLQDAISGLRNWQNENGRLAEDLGELDLDQIYVLEGSDNDDPNYSIPLEPKEERESFTREFLTLHSESSGYVGVIIQFDPDEEYSFASGLNNYSGWVRGFNLEHEVLVETYYLNGEPVANDANGRDDGGGSCLEVKAIMLNGALIGYQIVLTTGGSCGGGEPTEWEEVGGTPTGGDNNDNGEKNEESKKNGAKKDGKGKGVGVLNPCDKGFIKDSKGKCVREDCKTSKEDLKKAFPNASDATLKSLAEKLNKYAKDFGINTKEELQHFLAQAGHESTSVVSGKEFGAFEENLNYRWKKLGKKDYWDKYFNPVSDPTADAKKEDPRDYKRSTNSVFVNSKKFANYVYKDSNRDKNAALGNVNSGDGYKYRGRGIIQLTGRENYRSFNKFYKSKYDSKADLLSKPEQIATNMDIAVISALWYFENRVMKSIEFDKNTDIAKVTVLINGGTKGIDHREELFKQTKNNIDCN
ncbi:glycoside hydrolase family 19 protein [Ekhidna sp.]